MCLQVMESPACRRRCRFERQPVRRAYDLGMLCIRYHMALQRPEVLLLWLTWLSCAQSPPKCTPQDIGILW